MSLLEARSLGMRFQVGPVWARRELDALKNVQLSIEPSEVIGIVGESGSGKSTLGNILIGRLQPTQGHLLYQGRPLATWSRAQLRGKFAAVLQHPRWSLNPMLSIARSVIEPLEILGHAGPAAARRATVGDMLERVGLPGSYQDRHPHELSGGQRQRVSIARALITQPEFVLFDEAVSALDVSVQAQVLNLIKALQRDIGFSAVFISHDLAATRYVASRVVVMYAGAVVEEAPGALFYAQAGHPYSQGLQAASGLLEGSQYDLTLQEGAMPTHGCALQQRCPQVQDRCRQKIPELHPWHEGRVACHEVAMGTPE